MPDMHDIGRQLGLALPFLELDDEACGSASSSLSVEPLQTQLPQPVYSVHDTSFA